MSIAVRQPETLSRTYLFDEGCVKTRLNELTQAFISKLAMEEMNRGVDKAKRNFENIPTMPWSINPPLLEEMFGNQAREEAQKVLEQERQLFVNARSEYIERNLTQVIKRLRFLVYAVDEKGEPYKLKVVYDTVLKVNERGDWEKRQINYVGDHDFERFNQIGLWRTRLTEFQVYEPYFSEDLKALWKEAQDLGNLEIIEIDSTKPKEEETEKNADL